MDKPIDYNAIISAQQNVIDAQKKDIIELEFTSKRLSEQLYAVAKLSADEPMFYNPLDACRATAIRDEVLAAIKGE